MKMQIEPCEERAGKARNNEPALITLSRMTYTQKYDMNEMMSAFWSFVSLHASEIEDIRGYFCPLDAYARVITDMLGMGLREMQNAVGIDKEATERGL